MQFSILNLNFIGVVFYVSWFVYWCFYRSDGIINKWFLCKWFSCPYFFSFNLVVFEPVVQSSGIQASTGAAHLNFFAFDIKPCRKATMSLVPWFSKGFRSLQKPWTCRYEKIYYSVTKPRPLSCSHQSLLVFCTFAADDLFHFLAGKFFSFSND